MEPAAEPGASGSGSAVETVEDDVKYTIAELKAGARRLLNCSKHAVAGALALEKRESISLAEADQKVKAFLSKEVARSEQAIKRGLSL